MSPKPMLTHEIRNINGGYCQCYCLVKSLKSFPDQKKCRPNINNLTNYKEDWYKCDNGLFDNKSSCKIDCEIRNYIFDSCIDEHFIAGLPFAKSQS